MNKEEKVMKRLLKFSDEILVNEMLTFHFVN